MADLRPETRAAKAALDALAPTPGEMLTLLTCLTGSAPDAVIAAVGLVREQRAASSGETR
ncbi:hypothetical protein [Microbispora rosea]|uniref:hypothetical protein n=1 Tax=Microbispora rosea TaxID=58117 RepID=UPI0004C3B239|nr:hypothetical protein [Microbispora rosea]